MQLTLDLYRRNCIEGLFLSSGIARSEDETMNDLVRVAKALRLDHSFRGYIHLKTIPGASEELIAQAGLFADRLSMNVELPSERSLREYAPERMLPASRSEWRRHAHELKKPQRREKKAPGVIGRAKPPRFAPAGQSTQIIVGADNASDLSILDASVSFYASYGLKRVYYSGFSPTGHPSPNLPQTRTPLIREHRLYQADWLLRFYGFSLPDLQAAAPSGMLDLQIDPKLAWALQHRSQFPVDINRANREMLLRVPGLGTRAVDRIIASRRTGSLRLEDVARLTGAISRARPFIVTSDYSPRSLLDDAHLRQKLVPKPVQMALFE